ncbi:unnamed protein product [Phyllotreta striolata]|uniref:NADP-dependent oxidoreductase domain-containing protein n=1 Tax=Phyllotreta striolata TaxID=444603 RepID=A0A9N9TIQ1_PHYSR|nr:unnamed protein product [Phyllotreta striolata]
MRYLILVLSCIFAPSYGMEFLNNGPYKIPALGLGTFSVRDEVELTSALNEALETGYRHFDTAAIYMNEHIVGKVLNEWISSGKLKRDELFITTKLSLFDEQPGLVENAIKTSLKKLQLDYIDLWLIHFPVAVQITVEKEAITLPTDLEGVWKEMEQQVALGRTRTIGLSNFNISQIKRIQNVAKIKPANLQIETHLYFQQNKLRSFARKNNITVVAYSPLASPAMPQFYKEALTSGAPLPNIFNDSAISAIAKKHKKTNAQVALKYLLQSGLVVIPRSTNPKRIRENFDIFNFHLDDGDMLALKRLDRGKKAKVFLMLNLAKEMTKHPEYPFRENLP